MEALAGCLAAVLAFAAPTSTPGVGQKAAPQSLGPDEVVLKNGGFVRGTVVEVVPDEKVVILADGSSEPREILWADVDKVERGKHRTEPKPEPVAAPPPKPEAVPVPAAPKVERGPAPGPGAPRVHIELTKDVPLTLYEVSAEIQASGYGSSLYGMKYRSVCAAPCDRVIDGNRGQSFFLGRSIWTASRKFRLSEQSGDVTLRVKPGSTAVRIIGSVLVGIGIGTAIGGAVLVFSEDLRPIGTGFLVTGAVTLGAGIPMLIVGRTRYKLVGSK